MRTLTVIASALILAACQPQPPAADPLVEPLTRRVEDMELRLAVAEQQIAKQLVATPSPAPPKAMGAELVVTWPRKEGADYRRQYASMDQCQRAQDVVDRDSQARIAASQADVGTTSNGVRVVAAGKPETPSAICLPM